MKDRLGKSKNVELIGKIEEFPYFKVKIFNKNKNYLYFNFMILGILNGVIYSLVITEAQKLATNFGKEKFVSAFQLTLTFFGITVRFINGRFLLKLQHKTKIYISLILLITALLNFFLASNFIKNPDLGFGLCVVSSLLTGAFGALASLTCLGYMKSLPPWVIGGYAAGSGIAGMAGALISVVFGILNVEFGDVCLILILPNVLYLYSFFGIVRLKNKVDQLYELFLRNDELIEKEKYFYEKASGKILIYLKDQKIQRKILPKIL